MSLSLQSDDKQSYDNIEFIKSYDEYHISCDLLNDDYAKVYNHKFTEEDINKLSSWLKEILSIEEFDKLKKEVADIKKKIKKPTKKSVKNTSAESVKTDLTAEENK